MSKTSKKKLPNSEVTFIKCELNSEGILESFLIVTTGFLRDGHGLLLMPDKSTADSINFTMAPLEFPNCLATPLVRKEFLQQVQGVALSTMPANSRGGAHD